jgi:hypothetical protein
VTDHSLYTCVYGVKLIVYGYVKIIRCGGVCAGSSSGAGSGSDGKAVKESSIPDLLVSTVGDLQ